MSAIDVKTLEQFEKLQKEPGVLVTHFQAEWAPQCTQINDVIKELSKKHQKGVVFANVMAEDLAELSQRMSVSAVPTVVITHTAEAGATPQQAGRVDGAKPADLSTLVANVVEKKSLESNNISRKTEASSSPQALDERLKQLVNSAPCMLFMKGNKEEPKCGFSKKVVELLNGHNAEYSTFDILTDDEVRQGLKVFSDWPTYPQLYIKGDLIGGLDILHEMDTSGELDPTLIKKVNLNDRLKQLINQAPIMSFIKGSRDSPRCGFSRTLIQILNDTNISYETFDILSDEDVRQGLKTFSNWPTYPQVYVKGDLIGGLDIIKEMLSDGSLLDAFKGQ